MRPVLILAGAPRVRVDAVRHLTVAATGATAVALAEHPALAAIELTILASRDACPGAAVLRYTERSDLDAGVRNWLAGHPEGVVVASAAVNDYEVAAIEHDSGTGHHVVATGAKLQSGAREVLIRLRPAPKLVDALPGWGHRGPLVAFKYEAAESVIASAEALRRRCHAALVVANSIDGSVQALVDADGVRHHAGRGALLDALAQDLAALAVLPLPAAQR